MVVIGQRVGKVVICFLFFFVEGLVVLMLGKDSACGSDEMAGFVVRELQMEKKMR